MKYILTTLVFLVITSTLFSMPKPRLAQVNIDKQDSVSIAINEMEFSLAIAIIDRILLENKDSTMLRQLSLRKVGCLKKLYKFNDAIKLLVGMYDENFLAGKAIDVEVATELADAYMSIGDMDSAFIMYVLLNRTFPENLYYALRCADLLYKLKYYGEVISLGNSILIRDSTHYSTLSLVGDSFNKMEKSDSALLYYNKMLKINPMDYRVLDKKSKILLSKEMYPEVIELTGDYLSQDSVNLIINSIYGLALHLDTQYMESIKVYEKLISLGDTTYNTNYCLGLNHYMMDSYYQAEVYFEKAFQADSSDVNLVCYYAISTTWQSYRIDRTTKLLDYAYSLTQPDSVLVGKVYSGYATSYFKLKRYQDAIPYYIKSHKYNTSFISALSALGYCYKQEKDYKKAKEYYQAYLKVARKDSDGYNAIEARLEDVKGELFWIEN